jgi:hypothetical protein
VLICGIVFVAGFMLGGMIAPLLGAQIVVPEGLDPGGALLAMAASSPLFGVAAWLIARGLGGGRWSRAFRVAFFTWIVYGLNTALEALIILPTGTSFWFTNVSALVGSIFVGAAAAFLFPSPEPGLGVWSAVRSWAGARTAQDWAWRLAVAALIFMPIYYVFGLLAIAVTGPYYAANIAGLTAPTLEQLLPILLVRSVLFLVGCLPVVVLWRRSERSLFWSLAAGLFILVGFVSLVAAYWMPMIVRVVHSLEILADEVVYAWVLVKLLWPSGARAEAKTRVETASAEARARA